MSRSLWRCRNPDCPTSHGAVLGRVVSGDGLVLDPAVRQLSTFMDTRKAVIVCPMCGTARVFRGAAVHVTQKGS